MAAVVGAGRELVDVHVVADHEHLHGHHADEVEPLGDRGAQLPGALLGAVGKMSRDVRRVEDAHDVLVLSDGIVGHPPVGGAGHHDRQLPVELQPLLQHARHVAQVVPHARQVGLVPHAVLALAVVAEASGLQDRRELEVARGGDVVLVADHSVRRDVGPEVAQELLLVDSVLGDGDRPRRRPHRHAAGDRGQRRRPVRSRTRS